MLWRRRMVAGFLLALVVLVAGCGRGSGTGASEIEGAAQQAALKKSADWYQKQVYGLAEREARKAGQSPAAQYALFQSLAKQEEAPKQDEAEKIATSLQASLKADQGEEVVKFLAHRKEAGEIAELKAKLGLPEADQVSVLAQYPESKRGPAFHALVFQTLSKKRDSVTKSSLVYLSASQLMDKPGEPLAESARALVERVNESANLAQSPLDAFKRLHGASQSAPDGVFGELLKGTTIVKVGEKITGEMGKVNATLSLATPWGKQQRQVVIACSKRKGAWQVNTKKSDLSSMGVKLGQKEHSLTPSGISGVINVDQSTFADLKESLELVDADALARMVRNNGNDTKSELFLCPSLDILLLDESPLELVVVGYRNRLENGVGVGDTVADFCKTHQIVYPKTPTLNISGVLPWGFLRDQQVQGVWTIDLVGDQGGPVLAVYISGPNITPVSRAEIHALKDGTQGRPSTEEILQSRVIAMGYTKAPIAEYKR